MSATIVGVLLLALVGCVLLAPESAWRSPPAVTLAAAVLGPIPRWSPPAEWWSTAGSRRVRPDVVVGLAMFALWILSFA